MLNPHNFKNFQFNFNLQILAAFKTLILFILDSAEQNTSVLPQNLQLHPLSVHFYLKCKW